MIAEGSDRNLVESDQKAEEGENAACREASESPPGHCSGSESQKDGNEGVLELKKGPLENEVEELFNPASRGMAEEGEVLDLDQSAEREMAESQAEGKSLGRIALAGVHANRLTEENTDASLFLRTGCTSGGVFQKDGAGHFRAGAWFRSMIGWGYGLVRGCLIPNAS